MAKLEYSQLIDKHFPSFFNYRSLRPIFDPSSSEWDNSDFSSKCTVLRNILKIKPLDYWVEEYKQYYESLKKEYILTNIPKALIMYYEVMNDLGKDEYVVRSILEYFLKHKIEFFRGLKWAFRGEKLPHDILGEEYLELSEEYKNYINNVHNSI